jgi:hypothetical protein
MPVGKVRPETIVTGGPCRLMRTIAPGARGRAARSCSFPARTACRRGRRSRGPSLPRSRRLEVREPAGIVQARRKGRDNRPACCCAWMLCGGRALPVTSNSTPHRSRHRPHVAPSAVSWTSHGGRSPHDLHTICVAPTHARVAVLGDKGPRPAGGNLWHGSAAACQCLTSESTLVRTLPITLA